MDVIGPVDDAMTFAMKKFHDANPKTVKAFLAALNEAEQIIKKDPRAAAEKYLDVMHEKYSVDELVRIISDPQNRYFMTPYGTMNFCQVHVPLRYPQASTRQLEGNILPGSA